jgi:glycosyl transferase family 4
MKRKLMYAISEDWFFCSHFLERALAARDLGYDVVVMARERAHGQKIRAAGFRLLPLNFDRCSVNPLKGLVLLLRIYLAYRRERPDVLHRLASKPILYGSLAAVFLRRKPVIVNGLLGMGYVFSSPQRLARLLRPFLRLAYRLFLNLRRSRVILSELQIRGARLARYAVGRIMRWADRECFLKAVDRRIVETLIPGFKSSAHLAKYDFAVEALINSRFEGLPLLKLTDPLRDGGAARQFQRHKALFRYPYRVLICVPRLRMGGADKVAANLAHALSNLYRPKDDLL